MGRPPGATGGVVRLDDERWGQRVCAAVPSANASRRTGHRLRRSRPGDAQGPKDRCHRGTDYAHEHGMQRPASPSCPKAPVSRGPIRRHQPRTQRPWRSGHRGRRRAPCWGAGSDRFVCRGPFFNLVGPSDAQSSAAVAEAVYGHPVGGRGQCATAHWSGGRDLVVTAGGIEDSMIGCSGLPMGFHVG